jgi:hypothetical protein
MTLAISYWVLVHTCMAQCPAPPKEEAWPQWPQAFHLSEQTLPLPSYSLC